MKKIIFILILVSCLFITGCNFQVLDFNYTFTYAYVKIGEEWFDLEIESWKDYEGEQFQIKLKGGTVMVVSSINCILHNGNLPKGE